MKEWLSGKRLLAAFLSVILCAFLLMSGCDVDIWPEESDAPETTQSADATITQPSTEGSSATAGQKTEPTSSDGTTAALVPEKTTVASKTTLTVPTKVTPPDDIIINTALTPLQPGDYYGYTLLQKNGDNRLLEVYTAIAEAVGAYKTEITLNTSERDKRITPAELARVFYYYVDDYPQHFWREKGYSYSMLSVGGKTFVRTVTFTFNMDADDIPAARAAMEKKMTGFLDGLSGNMSEFERERRLHDRLVRFVEYSEAENPPASVYTLYGALVKGSAVCEGYARAFQYLMYQAGIRCMITIGNSRGVPHAWNIVIIDGQPYHMDVTWNDQGKDTQGKDVILYFYFNITTAQIRQDHTITYDFFNDTDYQTSYPVPDCTATAAEYHNKIGASMTGFSADIVAQQIIAAAKSGTPYVSLRSTLTPDDFIGAYRDKDNFAAVKRKTEAAGVKLGSYSWYTNATLKAVCIRYQ